MNIKIKLKEIEREEVRLARKKKALLEAEKQKEQLLSKLEALVKQSGYASPKELVEALVVHYNIRVGSVRKKAAGSTTRRKRTKMTPELRDEMKKAVKAGESMNAVAKRMAISYAVVVKAVNGAYDKLKK